VGEATAAGAIATYKVNDNITVVAAGLDWMTNTELGTSLGSKGDNTIVAAAVFSQDNIKAEAWYFNVKDMIDSDIVLRADFKANENIALHADYATAELDDSISKDTQTYYNVSATYTQDQICAKVGYVATGKDGGIVALDGDSPLAHVLPTEQKTGIANTADDNAVYAKLGYKVDPKTNVFCSIF